MENVGKIRYPLLVVFLSIFLHSCSSRNVDRAENQSESKTKNEPEMVKGDAIHESNEDLFKTDYKEIYDELSAKGEWIEVNAEDIGIDPKNISAGESELQKFLSENILGVKTAYADDASAAMLFVWKPAPELAVTLGTGTNTSASMNVSAGYVPYANGQWVNTNNGWYFAAPTPEEEIVHHYGRWVYQPSIGGWAWVPGRVWSPAWVEWKENDNYVSWAPLSAGVYIDGNTVSYSPAPPEQYIIVEKKYFVEPQVYRYYYPERNVVILNEMEPINGITVVDNRVVNKGPDVLVISNATGVTLPVATVNQVHVLSGVHFDNNQVNTYIPFFRVHKGKTDNIVISSPKKFTIRNNSAGRKERSGDQQLQVNPGNDKQKNGPTNLRDKKQKKNDDLKVRGGQENRKLKENPGNRNNNDKKIFKDNSGKKNDNSNRGNDKKIKGNKDNSSDKQGNKEQRKGGDKNNGRNKGKNKK